MRLPALCAPLAAAALAVGCTTPSSPGPEPTGAAAASVTTAAPSAAASSPRAGERRRGPDGDGHRRSGASPIARLLHDADELELTEVQRATVERLVRDLRTPSGARDAQRAMHDELLAGVRAGKIDPGKLDARRADADKAQATRHDRELEALGALHAALTPAQRKTLVTAARQRRAARDERGEDRPDKGPPSGDPTGFATRRAERLTKQLELDPAQQKRVEALVAKDRPEALTPAARQAERHEAERRVDAVWAAFEADTFDATKLGTLPAPPPKAKSRMTRELGFLAELLPILRPEQRERLAASMERRFEHHGPGGRGQGHPALFDD